MSKVPIGLIIKDLIAKKNLSVASVATALGISRQAVYQSFISSWSNGPVEGQVNRLKNIKRQMYGRASFELLRKQVVITSQS